MNTNRYILATHNPVTRNNGVVWHRLHSEREDICEALLKECGTDVEPPGLAHGTSPEKALRTANWHRELLQARLRKTNDALDRLMSGSYGACCTCGRWIEDTKLNFDPAIAYCIDCWRRMQTKH